MPVHSLPLSLSPQIQKASQNLPPLKFGVSGEGVATLQQVLADLGYPMPRSFYPATGKPDGHYGEETVKTVWKFQASQRLPTDGQAGKDTLTCLDTIISTGWFGRLLEIGGVIAYELDRNLLRTPTPSIYGSDLAALRRECDQLRQILQRYGRRPAPRSDIIFAAMKKRPGALASTRFLAERSLQRTRPRARCNC